MYLVYLKLIRDQRLFKKELFGHYPAKKLLGVLNYRTEYQIST